MSRLLAVVGAVLLGSALLSGCDPNPQFTPAGNEKSAITSTVTPTTVTTTDTTEPTTSTTTTTVAPPPTTTVAPPPPVTTHAAVAPPPPPQTHSQTACGANQYRNVDGVCVNRPVAAPGPPPGATAKCNDGTYSFSQHHQGTCSGHKGVAVWYS
jgi:hypothetical protein